MVSAKLAEEITQHGSGSGVGFTKVEKSDPRSKYPYSKGSEEMLGYMNDYSTFPIDLTISAIFFASVFQ